MRGEGAAFMREQKRWSATAPGRSQRTPRRTQGPERRGGGVVHELEPGGARTIPLGRRVGAPRGSEPRPPGEALRQVVLHALLPFVGEKRQTVGRRPVERVRYSRSRPGRWDRTERVVPVYC